jgi:hypothetical protein
LGDIVGGIIGGLTGIGDGNGTGDGSGDGSGDGDGNGMNNGLFVSIVNQTPLTESILFPPKFTELDNVQLGMFERFLRAAGGR